MLFLMQISDDNVLQLYLKHLIFESTRLKLLRFQPQDDEKN